MKNGNKKTARSVLSTLLALVLFCSSFAGINAFASMPKQDHSAIGTAYDGVDFDALITGRIYLGAMEQVVSLKGVFYGDVAKEREQFPTPILWRSVGEDGNQDGSSKDNAIALFSQYVIDARKFSASGRPVYSEWSGEADYDASFLSGWLNAEGLYSRGSMTATGFGDSFKILAGDGSTRYDAELDAIVRSTVDTYFIAQATQANSELVITNPGDVYLYSSVTMGEWTSYFSSSVTPFDEWPVVQTDVLAYLPFGVRSYTTWPSNYRVFYNASGLPMTTVSENYSIGTPGDVLYRGLTKYGLSCAYWLRNPIGLASDSGSTRPYTVSPGGIVRAFETAGDGSGIRPITKLNPASIVMVHEIVDAPPVYTNQLQADKTGGIQWNYEAGDSGLSNYKLTLLSDRVALNSLESAMGDPLVPGDVLAVNTAGSIAVKSSSYIGDYLAYKIVRTAASGNREIVGHGTSKGATPDVLAIPAIRNTIDNHDLAPDQYHIYIWAQGEDTEGSNGTSVHSFEASDAMVFELAVKEPACDLTYDPNTADTVTNMPSPLQETYQPGDTVVIASDEPARDGYSFLGWNTAADGSGAWYSLSGIQSFVITGDVTLYAQWQENLSFNLTLSKIVTGRYGDQTKKFDLTITLKDAGQPVSGIYSTKVGATSGTITFDSTGKATLSLAHQESVTILKIPADYTVSVVETAASSYGYFVTYRTERLLDNQGVYTYDDTSPGEALVEITNDAIEAVPTAVQMNGYIDSLLLSGTVASSLCLWFLLLRRRKRQ